MLNDTRQALRALRARPGFTTAAIITLAAGIGVTTAVYSVYNAVLVRPLPFPHPERLATIEVQQRTGGIYGISGGTLLAARSLPAVDRAAVMVGAEQIILDGGNPEFVRGAAVSDQFFDVFGVSPILGRTFRAADSSAGSQVVVLSHRLWERRLGGDRGVVGRTLRFDGSVRTVLGVMPEDFQYPEEAEFWMPYVMSGGELASVGAGPFTGLARLTSSDMLTAARQAAALETSTGGAAGEGSKVIFVPLIESMAGPYRENLNLLLGAVGLVFLIACLNVANLLLGQSAAREQELAIRRAIGATPWHVMRQLIAESAILAGAAAAAGLLLAQALVMSLPWLGTPEVPRLHETSTDWRVLVFVAGAAGASVCIFGLVPAWFVSRRQTAALRAATVVAGPRRQTASHLLIGVQIAGTLALLVASGLTLASLYRLHRVDLGFDAAHLTMTAIRPSRDVLRRLGAITFHNRVLERLHQDPEIQSAAMISHVPLDRVLAPRATVTADGGRVFPAGRDGATLRIVSPGAFQTLGVPILRGRDFSTADTADAPAAAVVNQAFAQKVWGNRDPLGQQLLVEAAGFKRRYDVVGITRDFRPSARRTPHAEVYVSATQAASRLQVVVRSNLRTDVLADRIRAAIHAEDPDTPMTGLTTASQLIATGNAYTRFHAALITIFGSFAALLASSGILGVVAYTVARRTREMGIRIAIGAAPRQVVVLLVREMTVPVLLGISGGLVLIYNLSYLLQRQGVLFDVRPFDLTVYGGVTVVLAALAVIATWLPARAAGRADPIVALRAE